jgi:hypothetical protein
MERLSGLRDDACRADEAEAKGRLLDLVDRFVEILEDAREQTD